MSDVTPALQQTTERARLAALLVDYVLELSHTRGELWRTCADLQAQRELTRTAIAMLADSNRETARARASAQHLREQLRAKVALTREAAA